MPTATGAAKAPSAPNCPASITDNMPTTAPKLMQTMVLVSPSVLPPLWKKQAQAMNACQICIWKAASGPRNTHVATTANNPIETANAISTVILSLLAFRWMARARRRRPRTGDATLLQLPAAHVAADRSVFARGRSETVHREPGHTIHRASQRKSRSLRSTG